MNEEIIKDLYIESLTTGGSGITHHQGKVLFIPLTAPGDRVTARIVKDKKRYAEAELIEIEAPGPERTVAPCPLYGMCGGCDFQHLTYEAQITAKRQNLQDQISRVAHLDVTPEPTVQSPEPWGYRRAVRLAVENGKIGFRKRSSREIVDVEHCPLLSPGLSEALAKLRHSASDLSATCTEVELKEGSDGTIKIYKLPRDRQKVPFQQVNAGINGLAIDQIEAWTSQYRKELGRQLQVLDLFAGDGNLSLPLADHCSRITGYDIADPAIQRARKEALNFPEKPFRYITSPLSKVLKKQLFDGSDSDLLILDPPRAGLKGLSDRVAELKIPRVVYLSCDPATLCRDLNSFTARGYKVRSIRPYDMFPQTSHIETLVLLEHSLISD